MLAVNSIKAEYNFSVWWPRHSTTKEATKDFSDFNLYEYFSLPTIGLGSSQFLVQNSQLDIRGAQRRKLFGRTNGIYMDELTLRRSDFIYKVAELLCYVTNSFSIIHSLIHSTMSLTSPQPLPKRIFETVQSSASSFISSILLFHIGHLVAAYVFFLVFVSLPSFFLSFRP
jgi:hypothetical protein